MDGIRRASEIIMMAGVAFRRRAAISLAMASQTIQADVSAGQGEIGLIVIESAFIPTAGSMAVFTGRGIILGDVIFRLFVVLLVAGIAERGRPCVHPVGVAFGAIGRNVRSGQRIAGLGVMIET